jgi:2,4-dienoyl-CoA reductase (NADPH2)
VAIIGAGGIGFDVAEYLLHELAPNGAAHGAVEGVGAFFSEWGVDTAYDAPGGLKPPQAPRPLRSVTLLQRKPEKPGRTLGLSTGWALRARLEQRGLQTLSGCTYERIDDAGLHLRVGTEARVLDVDTVVICAGQESETMLADTLRSQGLAPQVIGGAELAAELDALRAIDQGTRLAMTF